MRTVVEMSAYSSKKGFKGMYAAIRFRTNLPRYLRTCMAVLYSKLSFRTVPSGRPLSRLGRKEIEEYGYHQYPDNDCSRSSEYKTSIAVVNLPSQQPRID